MKLNLGCGSTKLPGFVNIDVEPSTKPDTVCNFAKEPLPYNNNSTEEIVMFHVIEHIPKVRHPFILKEIHRVLKPNGKLLMSYPEFNKCYKNWKTNYKGMKEFWEATLYGRQLYPSDYHVCIMDTPDFTDLLTSLGFKNVISKPEPTETYNTVIQCFKGAGIVTYEQLLANDMKGRKIRGIKCK